GGGGGEVGGGGMGVGGGGGGMCEGGAWRTDAVRAALAGQGVEIDGRGAQGFRLTSDSPIRINGREYPAIIDVVRTGEGLAIVNVTCLGGVVDAVDATRRTRTG